MAMIAAVDHDLEFRAGGIGREMVAGELARAQIQASEQRSFGNDILQKDDWVIGVPDPLVDEGFPRSKWWLAVPGQIVEITDNNCLVRSFVGETRLPVSSLRRALKKETSYLYESGSISFDVDRVGRSTTFERAVWEYTHMRLPKPTKNKVNIKYSALICTLEDNSKLVIGAVSGTKPLPDSLNLDPQCVEIGGEKVKFHLANCGTSSTGLLQVELFKLEARERYWCVREYINRYGRFLCRLSNANKEERERLFEDFNITDLRKRQSHMRMAKTLMKELNYDLRWFEYIGGKVEHPGKRECDWGFPRDVSYHESSTMNELTFRLFCPHLRQGNRLLRNHPRLLGGRFASTLKDLENYYVECMESETIRGISESMELEKTLIAELLCQAQVVQNSPFASEFFDLFARGPPKFHDDMIQCAEENAMRLFHELVKKKTFGKSLVQVRMVSGNKEHSPTYICAMCNARMKCSWYRLFD